MKRIIILVIVLAFLCISFIGYKSETIENVNTEVDAIDGDREIVCVYFPKLPNMSFDSEKLELDKNLTVEEKIYRIIDKLIKGPETKELIDIMPIETVLRKVRVSDGIAYLDFSKEFIENHPGGSIGEYNTIYCIVNSVTELSEIDAVDFSIEGEKFATYKGHCKFSEPLYRDELF